MKQDVAEFLKWKLKSYFKADDWINQLPWEALDSAKMTVQSSDDKLLRETQQIKIKDNFRPKKDSENHQAIVLEMNGMTICI